MEFLSFDELVPKMDKLSQSGQKFSFIIDYKGEKCGLFTTEKTDLHTKDRLVNDYFFTIHPIEFQTYQKKFEEVQSALREGRSFLLNLTQETEITTNLSLEEIFINAKAKYKYLLKDQFVVFSPETFVQIIDNVIYSFPMKGTQKDIDLNSKQKLIDNEKENAEHATIVDLIRNDLSKVAYPIQVEHFKFLEKVKTNKGNLWQMSSKISGQIIPKYKGKIGSILQELLPAGSITGAPKASTCELIEEIEGYSRGFYTGIMGEFDGKNLDSAVMIRFIEQRGEKKYFKSGGGITVFSKAENEYQELIDKIYLPF